MLSESIIFVLLLLISAQTSSLWTSLIIIPMSILLISMTSSLNNFSSMSLILYVLVFIGGLLVLLVSVTSISNHEQSFYFLKIWALFLCFMSTNFILSMKFSYNLMSNYITNWFESSQGLILMSILFLCVAFLLLSKLITQYKGMIRNI